MGAVFGGNCLLFFALALSTAARADVPRTSHLEATETAITKGATQAALCSEAAERIRSTFYKACLNGLLLSFVCTDEEDPARSACTRHCEAQCEFASVEGADRPVGTTVTTVERMNLDVAFAFDSARLRLDATTVSSLHVLAIKLRRLPERRVRIEGHTDNVGTAEYNRDLSLRRANAVKAYLIDREGIGPARIETVGYGFSRPLAPNASAQGRARNRRMEAEFEGAEVRVRALTSG